MTCAWRATAMKCGTLTVAAFFALEGGTRTDLSQGLSQTAPKSRPSRLVFEQNEGQAPASISFLVRGARHMAAIGHTGELLVAHNITSARPRTGAADTASEHESVAVAHQLPLIIRPMDVSARAKPVGSIPCAVQISYLRGPNPKRWIVDVPTFDAVGIEEIYAGIDLRYRGRDDTVEYEFLVRPHADPNAIKLAFTGSDSLSIDNSGNLLIRQGETVLRLRSPAAYQRIGETLLPIQVSYELLSVNNAGFRVGAYDRRHSLTIDPVLEYASYFGGSFYDFPGTVAAGSENTVWISGTTNSTRLLGTTRSNIGEHDHDVVLAQLSADGALLGLRYLGGNNSDDLVDMKTDQAGNIYVLGTTSSTDFPTTPGAYRVTADGQTSFLAKFTPDGQIAYSTFFLSSIGTAPAALAVDSVGRAYIAGGTSSIAFPTTPSAFQHMPTALLNNEGRAFVTRFRADGSSVEYSTVLGGLGQTYALAVAVDDLGQASVTGVTTSSDFPFANATQSTRGGTEIDSFVTKFNSSGSGLVFSSYLGGPGAEVGRAVAVDVEGNVYVGGEATNAFPTTEGAFQTSASAGTNGFLAKFTPGGMRIYSTLLGGSGGDMILDVVADEKGRVYAVGGTSSADFPITQSGQQMDHRGSSDAYLGILTPYGTHLEYGTFLGGTRGETAFSAALMGNSVVVIGGTTSIDFPVYEAFQRSFLGLSDMFVASFDLTQTATRRTEEPRTIIENDRFGCNSGSIHAGFGEVAGGTVKISQPFRFGVDEAVIMREVKVMMGTNALANAYSDFPRVEIWDIQPQSADTGIPNHLIAARDGDRVPALLGELMTFDFSALRLQGNRWYAVVYSRTGPGSNLAFYRLLAIQRMNCSPALGDNQWYMRHLINGVWETPNGTTSYSNFVGHIITADSQSQLLNPRLLIDGDEVATEVQGHIFELSGTGFTPLGSVSVRLEQTDGTQIQFTAIADVEGRFAVRVPTACGTPVGTMTAVAVDLGSDLRSNTVRGDLVFGDCPIEYYALGDSIASGHGLGDEGDCRRSSRGYPYVVKRLLARRYGSPRMTLLACSGVRSDRPDPGGRIGSPGWLPSQVDSVIAALGTSPALVSITVGANDLDWAPRGFGEFALGGLGQAAFAWPGGFTRWIDSTAQRVKLALGLQIRRLLGRPNVAVVVTEVYNPFNRDSILFSFRPGIGCLTVRECYERTEYSVERLNAGFKEIVAEINEPDRLRLASVRVTFSGHESPQHECGSATPGVMETWVQYPSDEMSNSNPNIPWPLRLKSGVMQWRGDCFHPNDAGAAAYATAVNTAARQVSR